MFLFVLFAIEAISCYSYYLKTKESLELKNSIGLLQKFRYTAAHKLTPEFFNEIFTEHKYIPLSSKRPILFLGCSYVQGIGLKEEETLPYQIYKITGRDVYKRGIQGGGIQLALDMFETGEMTKQVPDAGYIIYVYLNYHKARLYDYQLDYLETEINQRYKLQNGKLVKIKQPKYPYYYSLFFVKQVQKYIEEKASYNEHHDYKLFNAVMEELLKQAKKNYKDVKFVILLYPTIDDYEEKRENILPLYEIKKLEKMGFIVIDAEKLTNKPIRNYEYRIADRDHPSGEVWKIIAPALAKVLNL